MHKPAGYQRPQASNTHIIKQARTKSLWAREPCAKHLGQCTRLDAMERGSYSSSPGPAHPRAPNGTTTTPDRPPRPSSRQCATWHTQHISRYGRAWRGLRGWPRPLCTQWWWGSPMEGTASPLPPPSWHNPRGPICTARGPAWDFSPLCSQPEPTPWLQSTSSNLFMLSPAQRVGEPRGHTFMQHSFELVLAC